MMINMYFLPEYQTLVSGQVYDKYINLNLENSQWYCFDQPPISQNWCQSKYMMITKKKWYSLQPRSKAFPLETPLPVSEAKALVTRLNRIHCERQITTEADIQRTKSEDFANKPLCKHKSVGCINIMGSASKQVKLSFLFIAGSVP